MSFDLILLEVSTDADAATVTERVAELDARTLEGTGHLERKQRLAAAIMSVEPRYQVGEKDYDAIAEFEQISMEEARRRYDYVQLDGPSDQKMAQIVIHGEHIVIHWYSGTDEDEMDSYLRVLCDETGYAVFDPQGSLILRLTEN